MNEDLKQMNIPGMSVAKAIEKLEVLYCAVIENGGTFKNIPTPFFWGPAGVGKSEGVYQMAGNIAKKTGKKVLVTDVRLLLFSPVDLRGVPIADDEKRFTNWLMPKIFDMDKSDECINFLFLDELSAAPQSVQAAAYQICLDRRIGEFALPKNCIVIAAGNRTTDQSVSYKMPKALCNRLMHFNIKSDYVAWRTWAVEHAVSDKVIAYLGFDNSRLCVEPENSDLAYATPRSWAFVSTLLNNTGNDPKAIHDLIAACVGNDNAIEFEAFCKGYINMPSVSDVVSGRSTELPKSHDMMFAMVSGLVAAIRDKGNELTVDQLDNICTYVIRLPKDFCMSFMKDITHIPDMNMKLMKCHGFQKWLSANKRFL